MLCLQEKVSLLVAEREKLQAEIAELQGRLGALEGMLGEGLTPAGVGAGTMAIVAEAAAYRSAVRDAEEELLRRKDRLAEAYANLRSLAAELGNAATFLGDDAASAKALEAALAEGAEGGVDEASLLSVEVLGALSTATAALTEERQRRIAQCREQWSQLARLETYLKAEEGEEIPPDAEGDGTDVVPEGASLTEEAMAALGERIDAAEAAVSGRLEEKRGRLDGLWGELGVGAEDREAYWDSLKQEDSPLAQLRSLHEVVRSHARRLELLRPLLAKIKEREDLLAKMAEFEERASDPSRLRSRSREAFRQLQEEEQFRKRVKKQYPRLRDDLLGLVGEWEELQGERFLYQGEHYRAVLEGEDTKSGLLHLKTFQAGKGKPSKALQDKDTNQVDAKPARPASARPASKVSGSAARRPASAVPRVATTQRRK